MPIYEYRCEACEAQFEEIVRHADSAAVCCPRCGAQVVQRLFSSFGVGHGVAAEVATNVTRENRGCGGGSCACGHAGEFFE